MRYLVLFFLALPLAVPAQAPVASAAQAPEPTMRSTTSEVLLDLVVRDKHGQIIHNLRPREVEVREDGVPQKLRHFEFVDGRKETPGSAAPASPAPAVAVGVPASASGSATTQQHTVNELRDFSVISIVIADLDPRGRKVTLDALRDFVKTELQPNTYIGVFSLGLPGLRAVQPYTNDGDKISAAVEEAAQSAISGQLRVPNQSSVPNTGLGAADEPASDNNGLPIGVPIGPTGPVTAPLNGPEALIQEMMETHWVDEMHDVYTDSMRYLTPLRNLVQSQAEIPGRKVVLLFSAGLPVHSDTVELLRSVISAANRANVSIYALDTRGITSQSTLDNARRLMKAGADASQREQTLRLIGGDQTIMPSMVLSEEMGQISVHSDTRSNLAELAEGTGGALLPDTLDLREPLRRAVEDVRTHYELSYSPTNTAIDGLFRTIEVKVSRPGAEVFARRGYYALPVVNGHQVYPFEMATLKAINTTPPLHQFDLHATALQFRPGPVRSQMEFVFETPIRGLQVNTNGQWAKVHVCITALLKNDQGQIVQKISKDIPYEVPVNKLPQLQRGIVSFTAPFLAAPGHYTLETAAVDRLSMKASVSRSELEVPTDSGLAMSDVAVARRVDAIRGPADSFDPLQAQVGKVTPELSKVIFREAADKLELYAVAYPPAPVDAPIDATVEIWREGKLVMKSPASAVSADPTGAASILAKLSTTGLPSGDYEAQVSFEYKGQKVTKAIAFTLAAGS
jgi:VWFA-related protein